MLRAVNHILNWESDVRMRSDVTRKQASVLAVSTKGGGLGD